MRAKPKITQVKNDGASSGLHPEPSRLYPPELTTWGKGGGFENNPGKDSFLSQISGGPQVTSVGGI